MTLFFIIPMSPSQWFTLLSLRAIGYWTEKTQGLYNYNLWAEGTLNCPLRYLLRYISFSVSMCKMWFFWVKCTDRWKIKCSSRRGSCTISSARFSFWPYLIILSLMPDDAESQDDIGAWGICSSLWWRDNTGVFNTADSDLIDFVWCFAALQYISLEG